MRNSNIIHWRLPAEKPIAGSRVIIETLNGEYVEEKISDDEVFDIWNESVIRWAYLHARKPDDDFDFSKYMNLPRDDENIKKVLRDDFNPPKDDKKEEENDKKLQKDIMDGIFYGSFLWRLLSGDSDGDAKCRECCCDGPNDSQDDKMDGLRSGMSKSDKDKDKGASNEEDSSKSKSVSDEDPYRIVADYLKASSDRTKALEKIEEIIKQYEKH